MCHTWLRDRVMERRGEITLRRDTEKERACVCIRPDVSNTMVTCSLPVNDQFIVLDVNMLYPGIESLQCPGTQWDYSGERELVTKF